MNEELPVIQIENIHRALLSVPDSSTRLAAVRDLDFLRTVLGIQSARIVQLNRMVPPDMQLPDAHRVSVAFLAFLNLAKVLGLTWAQKSSLLDVPERTLRRWAVKEPRLNAEQQKRMGLVPAIYYLAGKEFPDDPKRWLLRPDSHPKLEGRTPLARMLDGRYQDLALVFAIARSFEP
jgi:uncharacterized protein (DUF2384 family)